eukprot:762763-Hanusia_phi.AAC.5
MHQPRRRVIASMAGTAALTGEDKAIYHKFCSRCSCMMRSEEDYAVNSLVLLALAWSTKKATVPAIKYQKRAQIQSLDIDYPPLPYDGSFSITPEGSDGNDYKVSFNGADVDGASWRQYVPLAVWPEVEWFDEDG